VIHNTWASRATMGGRRISPRDFRLQIADSRLRTRVDRNWQSFPPYQMEAGTEPISFMRSGSSRTICARVAEAVSIGAKIPVISGLPIRGQVRPLEPWNSTIRCIPIYLLVAPGNNNSRKLGRTFFPGFGARSRRSGFGHWSVVLCSWLLPLGKGSAGDADFRVPEGT